MIFTKIVVDNFNIFYGRQPLDLSEGLYVLHGVNGRGKSTFLNAITWALFGEYEDRQGSVVTPTVMLNREAAKEGATTLSVELHIEDGADKVLVRRSFDTADAAAGVRLFVEKNGHALNHDAGEELLRSLLDRDVSRFFLFDGEELRRYEELLFGHGDGASEVRRSIEHILGLPALTNAVDDLWAVCDRFSSDATKEMRKEKSSQAAALLAEQIEKDLLDAKDDLDGLETELQKHLEALNDATALLQEYQSSQDLIKKKVEAEAEIANLEANREDTRSLKRKSLAGAFKDVLAVAVHARREALEADLSAEQQRAAWKLEADALEAALDVGTCDRCGEKLHTDSANAMRRRLNELRSQPQPVGVSADAAVTLGVLKAIQPNGQTTQAIDQDRMISKATTKIAQLEQRLRELTDQIEGVPEAELREASERREKALKNIGVAEEHIAEKKKNIEKKQSELAAARTEAAKHSTSKAAAVLKERSELASHLAKLFEDAIDQFRDAMRDKVGADASDLFVKLRHDPELVGLEINENYGLSAIGPDGQPTPGRSAGQEQIVAFSLIGSLSRNATRKAPIVMDTPLGRLDKAHKTNVMNNLADFGEQVILLVHDDEVGEDLLDAVRPSIVAEYDLHHESLFSTQIRKREVS